MKSYKVENEDVDVVVGEVILSMRQDDLYTVFC